MRRLPFSIRELLLATAVVALVLALLYERARYGAARAQLDDFLQAPHVWVWAPATLDDRIPIGGAVGVAAQFFYSDKLRFSQPITGKVSMIDSSSMKTIAEFSNVPTVGVPGRRSCVANFSSKLYGKTLPPGVYIFLVVMFDGDKEIGRGSSSMEFYKWPAP